MLCISSLLTDITLCNALFSLRIVVLEAVSTKEWRIKPLPLSHPPILSFLPSFPPALNTLSPLLHLPPFFSLHFLRLSTFILSSCPWSFISEDIYCFPLFFHVVFPFFSSTVFTASVLMNPAYFCVKLVRKLRTFQRKNPKNTIIDPLNY